LDKNISKVQDCINLMEITRQKADFKKELRKKHNREKEPGKRAKQ